MTQPILHDTKVQYLEELCDAGMLFLSMRNASMILDTDKGTYGRLTASIRIVIWNEPSQMDTDYSYSGPD